MSFLFFLLLNTILFIRPAELIESLQPFQLYQLAIIGCLISSYREWTSQLSFQSLSRRPISVCVVGLLAAIVLSHLQFGSLYDARTEGAEFGKIVLYYLLLLCNLNTPKKYQCFLSCLVCVTAVASGLALLQYYQVIDIPALAAYEQREIDDETGEVIVFSRLCGSGIFNDPNDVCLMLSASSLICIYRFMTPKLGWKRFLWLLPLAQFLVAFIETKSRGGFISLMLGLNILLVSRLGYRRCIPIWLAGLPLVLVLFGGRMTRLELEGGTGQHRIQLWREALGLLREYPLFGVGQGMLPEYTRLVAHNSYIHAFAELGVFGGSCFVSMVFLTISQLHRLRRFESHVSDDEMRRFRPYLLGMVCGFCAGIMSLSRVYIVPTYMVVGLAAAYLNQVQIKPKHKFRLPSCDLRLLWRMSAISAASLVALEIGSRLMVRWEG